MESNAPNPYFNPPNNTPSGGKRLPVWLTVIIVVILVLSIGSCTACVSCAACIACNSPEIVDELESLEDELDGFVDEYEDTSAALGDASQYTLKNHVLVDNEYCSITVMSIDPAEYSGFTVKVNCVNKTNSTLMFSVENCAICGWMIDPYWATTVTANSQVNESIVFDRNEILDCGITSVDKIDLSVQVYDTENWELDYFVEDTFVVYPTEKSADKIVSPVFEAAKDDVVVLETDNCRFIVVDIDDDSFWGYTIKCYIENKSDAPLVFSWEDSVVNGYDIDPFWSTTVNAKSCGYAYIDFLDSDFDENNIDNVEEIRFTLEVLDADTYDDIDSVAYVLNFR